MNRLGFQEAHHDVQWRSLIYPDNTIGSGHISRGPLAVVRGGEEAERDEYSLVRTVREHAAIADSFGIFGSQRFQQLS